MATTPTVTFDYTGFKIAEKKVLKEREVSYAPNLKKIQDKLGADWKLTIDWPAIEKWTSATSPGFNSKRLRGEVAYTLYDKWVPPLADEIARMDAELVEVLNENFPGKQIVISMHPDPNAPGRYSIEFGSGGGGGITLFIHQEFTGYEYPYPLKNTLTAKLENTF